MGYQEPKSRDYGVNLCDGCLEKQREIDRLKEEVQRLRQKLSQNQRKSQEGFFSSSTPSSKIPVKSNSLADNQVKKGGGQIGHRGVGRQSFKSEVADEQRIAEVSAESCETCQCRLHRMSSNERAIYEIERERVRKIYYTIERKVCPQCRRMLRGKVRNAMPRASLSNELIVEAAEQHYVLGRTLGQISDRLLINDATLASSLKRIGKLLKPCLEKLFAEYRAANIRHADETSWRTDGGNGWSWYFGSSTVSLHLFRASRSMSVVKEVLGNNRLNGVLVVDRYGAYNRVPCLIQYCYAHLLREMDDLEQEFDTQEEVQNYAAQMKLHLTDAMHLRQRGFSEEEYLKEAEKIKARILALSDRQAEHPAVRRWQDFFVEKADRLYQWCESSQIPAENNYAEREIRKVVIARKMSYGSQSEDGAKTREIWTSVLQSLKKREDNPRDKLIKVLNKLSQSEKFDIAEELFGGAESDLP